MSNNIISILNRKLFQKKIIQFGPIRSGSTLIYNYVRELFPKYYILKTHQISLNDCVKFPVIATIRNPLDSIASTILSRDLVPKEVELPQFIEEIRVQGLDDLIEIADHPDILLLKYEDFRYDHNYIITSLESYFDMKVAEEKKLYLLKKYDINQVEQYVLKFPQFGEYDKEQLWHGNHVSKFKGETGYYNKVFTENQIRLMLIEFKDVLEKFHYTN